MSIDSANFPAPGLNGNYQGSCVTCTRGTETGVAVRGPAEAAIAALTVFRVPQDQATTMVAEFTGSDTGQVPDGEITFPMRVCQECVDASGTNIAVGPISEVPVITLR